MGAVKVTESGTGTGMRDRARGGSRGSRLARVRQWYQRNATPWAVVRRDASSVLRHLPVVVAPAVFGFARARQVWVHWDDEDAICSAEREGFSAARYWNVLMCVVGVGLMAHATQSPWLGLGLGVLLWGLVNLASTAVLLVSASRFAHVHAGRRPGEDPDSPRVQRRSDRYWNAAMWDAYFARTGLTRKQVQQRRRRGEVLPDELVGLDELADYDDRYEGDQHDGWNENRE